MPSSPVIERYSRTAFRTALAEGSLPAITEEFRNMALVMEQNQALGDWLASPVVKISEKGSLLERVFGSRALPLTKKFLGLLVRKNRVDKLQEILESFQDLVNHHEGIVTGTVTSARALDPEQLARIAERYQARTSKLHRFENRVNPSLIGGFTIQIGDTVTDCSLKNKLEILHARMIA